MKDVICFEVNDWDEYPVFFNEWFDPRGNHSSPIIIDLDKYAKENKLCIKVVAVDMSISFIITAPKEWVENNIEEFNKGILADYYICNKPDLKPYMFTGCPSGEAFLDYKEENFGAIEVYEDYDTGDVTTWRVVNDSVIKEINGEVIKEISTPEKED